jgi:hypothetical protein
MANIYLIRRTWKARKNSRYFKPNNQNRWLEIYTRLMALRLSIMPGFNLFPPTEVKPVLLP